MVGKAITRWRCRDCGREFSVRAWILNHIDVGIDPIYCVYCGSKNTEMIEE